MTFAMITAVTMVAIAAETMTGLVFTTAAVFLGTVIAIVGRSTSVAGVTATR